MRFAPVVLPILLLAACSSHQPAPPPASHECAQDPDCQLLTRAALGCCEPCPTLEAMSAVRRTELEGLCNLHQGGETCPRLVSDCAPVDPGPWRAACVAGHCERVRE